MVAVAFEHVVVDRMSVLMLLMRVRVGSSFVAIYVEAEGQSMRVAARRIIRSYINKKKAGVQVAMVLYKTLVLGTRPCQTFR